MTQGIYSIRDLETLTGIKAHTIRIWEKRYNIVHPSRTSTNIRYYCDSELKKLLNISILLKHGFKISHLAAMSPEEIGEKILTISYQPTDTGTQIQNLISAMIRLDDFKFEKIIASSTMSLGFEETILKIIYPFLEQIGVLWLTGNINPAQEHFVSNILRQKLLVAIDSHSERPKENAKRFLLFLPENELHELGLLFYSYLVKKSGNKILYLGQSVPFEDIEAVSEVKEPDALITAFVSSVSYDELAAYIQKLSDQFQGKKIFVAGQQIQAYNRQLPANVIKINNVNELKKTLAKF